MMYHGLTIREAVLYIAAASAGAEVPSESTVRSWITRGNVRRSGNGQIDLSSLHEWWDNERDSKQAARRARVA